ncbi:MAG: cobyrinate a,c-diamide synthase [Methanoregula sp.]|nr:cobyrinate a,c-diamide synthase [Methanoregula sp.]MDP2797409.1 cobyrinate a,c-diamide synthase [Methanoregula sp.]
MNPVPRIVIAGTHSGCGKTTIASGIMAALTRRGLKVQPFKIGPDFIDPSHHTRICGRNSRNLDPFMMGKEGCINTFIRASEGADIAVIEGVMGMYDGVDGSDISSTAHVARILKAPVILVVDAKGMSRSVHALIDGFRRYDPTLTFSGVILNSIGSPRHRLMIEPSLTIPSFGFIPWKEELAVESRHLGLKMAHESASMGEFGKIIEENCNLDALLAAAHQSAPLRDMINTEECEQQAHSKIGVALDEAFCFYYQDNLDNLRKAGAELVFFSPLSGSLPDVDAVYLGGGYPELHLAELESSHCTQELKHAADSGMPVYAECGGLMYLTKEIRSDKTYRMCGILPACAEMTRSIQALGYVKGESIGNLSFLPASLPIKGHEFHYSRIEPARDARYALRLSRGKGIDGGKDGLISQNVLGCYTHAYFTPAFAHAMIDGAVHFSRQ